MSLPSFHDFTDESIKYSTKESLYLNKTGYDTMYLFVNYVNWLINTMKIDTATVSELIFQIQVISAYVQQQLINAKNNSKVEIISVPDAIRNTTDEFKNKSVSSVTTIFQFLDNKIDPAVKIASTTFFETEYRARIIASVMISSILIGSAFTPHIVTGLAIALWSIGGLYAFALLVNVGSRYSKIFTPDELLSRNNEYVKAKVDTVDAILTQELKKDGVIHKGVTEIAALTHEDDYLVIKKIILNATVTRYFMPMYNVVQTPRPEPEAQDVLLQDLVPKPKT